MDKKLDAKLDKKLGIVRHMSRGSSALSPLRGQAATLCHLLYPVDTESRGRKVRQAPDKREVGLINRQGFESPALRHRLTRQAEVG